MQKYTHSPDKYVGCRRSRHGGDLLSGRLECCLFFGGEDAGLEPIAEAGDFFPEPHGALDSDDRWSW